GLPLRHLLPRLLRGHPLRQAAPELHLRGLPLRQPAPELHLRRPARGLLRRAQGLLLPRLR
ncbi:unnamed protein product, partial [Symbiodinium sp. KB8]